MPELFQKMYYGPNVQNLVESDDCMTVPANLPLLFIRRWEKRHWNIGNQLSDWHRKGRVERKKKLNHDKLRMVSRT